MIGDLLSTAARAQKLDIASIQRGIQDGVIPSYIGIPLLQQKMQERTEAAQMLAGKQAQNQPPIAQQVMSQAQQMTQPQAAPAMQQPQMQQPAEPGGIDQAQSNLPQAGFAGGGIVAFEDGGNVSMDPFADEDMSEEDMEDQQMDQDLMSDRQFAYAPESMAAPTYNEMSYSRDSSSMKEPGQPEHGVAHEEISAKGKRGLEDLLDLIKHKESRGRDYDTKGNPLTSPVGAKYAMQVMPATARDPGFGIKPAQSDSPDEYNRVGRELYSKLLDKYGDPKLAAIAYNMGPGKTDKWLSSGADMATLPSESRQYAQGFKEGGVAHFDGGGIADVFNMSPSEQYKDVKDYARRLRNMSDARAAFSAQPEAVAVAPAAEEGAALVGDAANTGRLYGAGRAAAGLANRTAPMIIGSEIVGNLGSYKFNEPNLDTSVSGVYNAAKKGNYSQAGKNLVMGLPEAGMDVVRGAAGLGDYLLPGQPLESGLDSLVKGYFGSKISTPSDAKMQASSAGAGRGFVNPTMDTIPGYQKMLSTPGQEKAPPDTTPDDRDIGGGWNPGQDTPFAEAPSDVGSQDENKEPTGIEALFSQQAADNKKQREINNYLALMSAGFGIMGGSSPYAFQNIGKGAQQGVATLAELNKGVGDDERALMNARISAHNAKARNDYYARVLEERKRAALSGEDIKKEDQANKVTTASSRIIQKMQEDAINNSRLVAKSRIDIAAKDLANPMSDEQRTHIYEDEKARALAGLRINPIFVHHSKIAIPGYDPSAVDLTQGQNDVVSKYLKPKS